MRVLRVIARLNMGGPALHVAYLTAGLAERGYETTLVAGSLARGEDSMAFVADELGLRVRSLPELHREISPVRDAIAAFRLARLIRRERPAILHTHTAKAGAVGRMAALLAGSARPPIVVHTFHGHVLRGYFDPVRTAGFRLLERLLARTSTSRSARRSATTSSPSAWRRANASPSSGSGSSSAIASRPMTPSATRRGACSGSRRTASSSAGSGA